MNERIKELITPKLKEWGGASGDNFSEELENFAELLVRECANIAAKNQAENMGWDISEIIKEHFGVEEQPICKHDWYSARNPVVKNGSVCVICGALDSREPEELKND